MTSANKHALVTGASKGIDRATAKVLAAEGYHVIVHYGRSEIEAWSLVAEIESAGGNALAVGATLEKPDAPALLAKQVRAIVKVRLDALVSNAGISKAGLLEEHSVADFDRLFATNVRSAFFQIAYFGHDGLLRRLEYAVDVLGGAEGLNYATEYREISGILLPMKRRVHPADAQRRKGEEPVLVAIDFHEIVIQ
jgi:NAD(P)-dependent dehydrogenase (short-subunit alcohol dehydrogenase family)